MNEWLQWATPGVMIALAGLGWRMLHSLSERIDSLSDRVNSIDRRLARIEGYLWREARHPEDAR